MTGPTGPVSGPCRPDDIESSVRCTGAFGGLLRFPSLPPPQPESWVTLGRRHGW